MGFSNLMNFSVYKHDLLRFNSDWLKVQEYLKNKSLNGLELLIGYDDISKDIPLDLIKSAHLPFWHTWLNVWNNGSEAAKVYFPKVNPSDMIYYCGGNDKIEMASSLSKLINNASTLSVEYAVIHAAHVEISHVFTRNYTYDSNMVLDAFACMLNATAKEFNSGEPSCTLAIENLWWPGLDFTHPGLTDEFASKLNFSNWNFLLDTGHLMNTNPRLRCEDEAIDYVLNSISRLSKDAQKKIKYCHLNSSLSGEYKLKYSRRGKPYNWSSLSETDKYNLALDYVINIDQHKAFYSNRVNEIIELINPKILVHELITKDQKSHSLAIDNQLALMK